jgi:hypothetical protein
VPERFCDRYDRVNTTVDTTSPSGAAALHSLPFTVSSFRPAEQAGAQRRKRPRPTIEWIADFPFPRLAARTLCQPNNYPDDNSALRKRPADCSDFVSRLCHAGQDASGFLRVADGRRANC